MRNLLSSLFFILIFVGLGAMAFAAAPRGQEAAQPAAAPAADVQAQEPTAPEAPSASTKLNTIALPLDVTGVSMASDVADYIDSSNIAYVMKWDAQTTPPRWVEYNVGFPPAGDPDFSVETGNALMLRVGSGFTSGSFAWVGDVPAAGTVKNSIVAGKLNFISIPLDQHASYGSPSAPVGQASDLAADIGGVTHVMAWDSTSTPARWIEYNAGFPPAGDPDFDVYAGYPYMIRTDGTAPAQWP